MSSIVTEYEALSLIEGENSLREIGNQSPSLYLTIFRSLEKIRQIDPEKAEGRRDYVSTDDLSKARLSMPAEIHAVIYGLQGFKSFEARKRSINSFTGSLVGLSLSLGLVAQNYIENTSTYVAAGALGVMALALQLRGFFYIGKWIHNEYRRKQDERFTRPLDQRESKLVQYIFMNDHSS
ncbi:hypothetical protein J4208_02040 [Candidatus Woesearchaeota archaeon]|nr:hypothetical protein [Candidatus Woesearchaeota archaeon]